MAKGVKEPVQLGVGSVLLDEPGVGAHIIDDVSPDGEAEAEAEAKVTAKGWLLHMNVNPIKDKT